MQFQIVACCKRGSRFQIMACCKRGSRFQIMACCERGLRFQTMAHCKRGLQDEGPLDRDGNLLRAWQVSDGRWRLPVTLDQVDPAYIAQLIAYEDGRYFDHPGVDLLAMGRAAAQGIWHGRLVSGASTLTMQVARLLGEMPTRSALAKVKQIRLALALEYLRRRETRSSIFQTEYALRPSARFKLGKRSICFQARAPLSSDCQAHVRVHCRRYSSHWQGRNGRNC